jgi:Tol biopolymer transport system component
MRHVERPDTYFPAGSPDGRTVAFTASRDGGLGQVYLTDPHAGGTERAITKGGGGLPRWSPDGQTIYFRGVGERDGNLWAVSAAGTMERAMTNLIGRRGAVGVTALATDGRYLYFTSAGRDRRPLDDGRGEREAMTMNRRAFVERGGKAPARFAPSGCATTNSRQSLAGTPRRAMVSLFDAES